jgi:uncharacterized protein YqgC (DUF456 family)
MSIAISILIWILTGAFFLAGLAGSVIPGLPGPPLVLAGALLYGLLTGFVDFGWTVMLILGLLAAVSQALDYLASAWGAKRFGGTAWGVGGSILGGLLGLLFFSLPGMIVGIFSGAVVPELLLTRKGTAAALKVGGGSLIGFLGGTLLKLVFALVMIGIFFYSVFIQS